MKKVLKAFVRYDYSGRVVPGSLVLRTTKPKNGDWNEVPAYKCCNPRPFLPIFNEPVTVVEGVTPSAIDISWNAATAYPENEIFGYDLFINGINGSFTTDLFINDFVVGPGLKIIQIGVVNGLGYTVLSEPVEILVT